MRSWRLLLPYCNQRLAFSFSPLLVLLRALAESSRPSRLHIHRFGRAIRHSLRHDDLLLFVHLRKTEGARQLEAEEDQRAEGAVVDAVLGRGEG